MGEQTVGAEILFCRYRRDTPFPGYYITPEFPCLCGRRSVGSSRPLVARANRILITADGLCVCGASGPSRAESRRQSGIRFAHAPTSFPFGETSAQVSWPPSSCSISAILTISPFPIYYLRMAYSPSLGYSIYTYSYCSASHDLDKTYTPIALARLLRADTFLAFPQCSDLPIATQSPQPRPRLIAFRD